MSDPLEFINIKRAKNAQRPLDPNRPAGQVEPWTRFDIEHEALALGWKPPIGYQLAPDPRSATVVLGPVAWWREFLRRYYRPGLTAKQGGLIMTAGSVKIGDILKNADFQVPSINWPGSDQDPEVYRERAIFLIRVFESYAPTDLYDRPLSPEKLTDLVFFIAGMLSDVLRPRNPQAMPPA